MSRWPRGEAQIEQLIANKALQQVIGGQANGAHLLQRASRTLETAGESETTTHDEAQRAIRDAEGLLMAAQQLLPTLSIF